MLWNQKIIKSLKLVPLVSDVCEAGLSHEWFSGPYRSQQTSSVPRKQITTQLKQLELQSKCTNCLTCSIHHSCNPKSFCFNALNWHYLVDAKVTTPFGEDILVGEITARRNSSLFTSKCASKYVNGNLAIVSVVNSRSLVYIREKVSQVSLEVCFSTWLCEESNTCTPDCWAISQPVKTLLLFSELKSIYHLLWWLSSHWLSC